MRRHIAKYGGEFSGSDRRYEGFKPHYFHDPGENASEAEVVAAKAAHSAFFAMCTRARILRRNCVIAERVADDVRAERVRGHQRVLKLQRDADRAWTRDQNEIRRERWLPPPDDLIARTSAVLTAAPPARTDSISERRRVLATL